MKWDRFEGEICWISLMHYPFSKPLKWSPHKMDKNFRLAYMVDCLVKRPTYMV